jgi:protein associated with RNAse G/E
VVRTRDGRVEILDEDEFADHQVRFGYPQKLIDGARAAAIEVVTLLERRNEPFGEAAAHWLEVAEQVFGPDRALSPR